MIRPLGARAMVQPIQREKYGMLHLAKSKKLSQLARVVAAGSGCAHVQNKDVVLLPRYLGDPTGQPDDTLIIEENDILAIFEDYDEEMDAQSIPSV